MKILADREQRIRLQFAEHAAKPLFYPINGVEKVAAVHIQLLAAQFPIGTEQEVITKNAIFQFGETPFANQTKVGDVFLILPAPGASSILARQRIQGDSAHVLFAIRAIAEALKAGPENRSEHAIARMHALLASDPQAQSEAGIATWRSERQSF